MERKINLPITQRILSPRNIKYVAILLMIIASVSMSFLSELIKAEFKPDVIRNAEFWYATANAVFRNVTFLIALLWTAMILSEKNLERLYTSLLDIWRWIINGKASNSFSSYLVEVNKTKKIRAYKEQLQQELVKKNLTSERRKEIKEILALSEEDIWKGSEAKENVIAFEGVEYMNVDYVHVSEAYLFSGISSKKNLQGDRYTPIVNTLWRITPPILIFTALSAVFYSFIPEFINATPDVYIMACINLLFLLMNGLGGYMIGEYTVSVEKRAFLEYRISVAYGFKGHALCPKDMPTDNTDNEEKLNN